MSTKAYLKFMDNTDELLIEQPHDGKPESILPWIYDHIIESDIITQKGVYEIVNHLITNNEYVTLGKNISPDATYYYEIDLMSKEITIFKRHHFTHELELTDIHKVQKTCVNVNQWMN